MKKNSGKIVALVITAICVLLFNLFILFGTLADKAQMIDNLNYDITLNNDGSMKIIETWDIYITHTNTIFKNFDKSSKFGKIKNVSVKDLQTGKELTQIYEEMYHVTTDCFYALDISGNKFEIAWGTGMEESKGKKKYQITYTVTDAATSYNDCQELYWMLLSEENTVPVKKVTGTVNLPMSVSNIENLKVWGHGPLNGNIERTSANQVKFDIDDLSSERMLEIRVVSADKIMEDISLAKTRNYNYLSNIISEETKWANSADKKAQIWKETRYVLLGIAVAIIIFQILRIIKFYKLFKKKDDGINKLNLKYYRDIPRDGKSTPMEAEYFYYFTKSLDKGKKYQSDAVAATILDLTMKKYISLRYEQDKIYIKILKDDGGLKDDEKAIYKLLKSAGKNEEEFEIGALNTYAKKHYNEYSFAIEKMVNMARENLYKEKLVDKGQKALYSKSKLAEGMYYIIAEIAMIVGIEFIISRIPYFERAFMIDFGTAYQNGFLTATLVVAPFIIVSLIKNKILSKIQNKIAVLTQEGYNEKEQWHGLAKFMQEYSKLDEASTPSLEIWERYLVFATAFGIADKVIEEMKAKYPEVFVEEYWADEKKNEYPVLNFSLYSGIHYHNTSTSPIHSISNSASKAYATSLKEISAHSASSSGGGGGFSGGGGGRRRRWPEWAADRRKNEKNSNRR